jgi:hypothetical protein
VLEGEYAIQLAVEFDGHSTLDLSCSNHSNASRIQRCLILAD